MDSQASFILLEWTLIWEHELAKKNEERLVRRIQRVLN